jgi:hypothetical protein
MTEPRRHRVAGEATGENRDRVPVAVHSRAAEVVSLASGPERYVVADIRTFDPYVLAGPTARLWAAVDGRTPDLELVDRVLRSFPDHPPSARDDCLAVITDLEERGLLTVIPNPNHPVAQKGALQ